MSPEQRREFAAIYATTSTTDLSQRFGLNRHAIYNLASEMRLKKDPIILSNLRSRNMRKRYAKTITEEPTLDGADYNPRRIVLEEIEYLLDSGYRADIADTVRQRLNYLKNNTLQWFEDRMHWTLGEWIERLGSLPKGAL